jgi:hypothetical protein
MKGSQMELPITLSTNELTLTDVKQHLENTSNISDSGVTLELRQEPEPVRLLPTDVLIAIIAAAGPALVALITGLIGLIKQKRSMYIEVHFDDGRIVKVPADISPQRLNALFDRVQRLKIKQIEIGSEESSKEEE